MIKANTHYGLNGAFKVDIYSGSVLVESGKWDNNFITPTGLYYPTIYSFANCFNFLSIGTDNRTNEGGVGVNPATTGLYGPLYSYNTSDGGTQNGTWMGWQALETGTSIRTDSSCLTQVGNGYLRFFRAWSVPSGAIGVTVNQPGGYLNIQELMVSPSSGGDPTGCYAFSRIPRTITLPNGYRAVISYQLQVNIKNSSLSSFGAGTFQTGNADVTNDYDLINQWGSLSGYYRQVWAGLSCVDSYGITFQPKYGNGMEPCLQNLNNYYIYFSPDNGQFDVNSVSGGAQTNSVIATGADGIMTPLGYPGTPILSMDSNRQGSLNPSDINATNNVYYGGMYYGQEPINRAVPTAFTPINIRLGAISSPLQAPNVANYSLDMTNNNLWQNNQFNYQTPNSSVDASIETITYATPGASGLDLSRSPNYMQQAVFSTRMYALPLVYTGYNVNTGRLKNITRKTIFAPANSLGYNTRFGSMVFSYFQDNGTPGNNTFYPIMDTLFYDTSGQSLMQHYRQISGIFMSERGTGVAGCTIKIMPTGININRLTGRRTVQGAITGGPIPNPFNVDGIPAPGNVFPGKNSTTSGNFYFQNASFGGCSGYGGVIGVTGFDYDLSSQYLYDIGIIGHTTGTVINPSGNLYWPNIYGNKLYVDISNIVFTSGGGTVWADNPSLSAATLASQSGFCRPTGYLLHYDNIGLSGFRLLPNFGAGNNVGTNTYSPPQYGGCLPALSLDNGMEVYLNLSWSSPCGPSVTPGSCYDPPF